MRTEGFFGTSDEDFAWALEMNFFIALRASRGAGQPDQDSRAGVRPARRPRQRGLAGARRD
jgi:hypothetical protein